MKKKINFALILTLMFSQTLISSYSFGQRIIIQNLPKYDRQQVHFGFMLGINVANFKVQKAADFNAYDSLYIVDNIKQSGFNLGIVSSLKLGENFDLRFIPSLIFAQRNMDYSFYAIHDHTANNPDSLKVFDHKVTKQIESTFVEFPLSLKFKSNRINNYRGYFLVGGQYMIDMVSQAKVQNKDKQYVKLERHDYGYHIGAGFDFYMELFKLSMELKMYSGLNNLLVPDESIYSSSLSKLRSKIFYISFYFE